MDERVRPAKTGQHGLGPHVVGRRVVVRRLVRGETGPSGGPAMTDVLGVCERWPDGPGDPDRTVLVRRDDGTAVAFPSTDVVSGKPVPPRPSVRRRVSPRAAEQHTLALFPTVRSAPLGEWLLRTDGMPDGRLVKRANSCLAMGDPGMSLDRAAGEVRSFYARAERPAIVQVEADGDLERGLRGLGWTAVPGGDAHFQLASVAAALRLLSASAGRRADADADAGADDAAVDVDVTEDGDRLVARIGELARGAAAVEGDWVGLHDIEVDLAHRRHGLGRAVLGALLDAAGARGALTAWLHVEVDNDAAARLYAAAGFATHHTCRYLAADPSDAAALGAAASPGDGGTQVRPATGA